MNKTPKLLKPMYNLLIEKNMDNFSILQARDELLKSTGRFSDETEARKFIHRQVHHLASKGYLVILGTGRQKRFKKTELFHKTNFSVRTENPKSVKIKEESNEPPTKRLDDHIVLIKERNQYQGELAISLAEAEEYKALLGRFPDRSTLLFQLHSAAKEKAATILGKMNAVNALIASIEQDGNQTC
ncbi:hypothetical protein [Vibrio cincinnatiensis]|uniref:hypothetical protein n=1 Tax=Vibrio cincinnatiensis TaxID=675 RepID=UPI001EDE2CAA|nr:hypothetical protein [Vibrio cincinnatiensis]MCG3726950.1 hypothetical protein [Vibrio cincinnatiensis]